MEHNRFRHRPTRHLFAALALLLAGCAAPGGGTQPTEPNPDPLEPVNRAMFRFNQEADKIVARPIARGYRAITPRVVRTGITNFFDTLAIPRILVNDLLQGKPKAAGQDTARLLLNLTLGLAGLIDIASLEGIPKNDEDFGQTLAVWGVPSGPYLLVPFLGAYTVRQGFGEILDWPLRPLTHVSDHRTRAQLVALALINRRTQLLGTDRLVDSALDPYLFVRGAYFQRREFVIHDGNPPQSDELEDALFEEGFSEEDFFEGD